MPNLPDHGRGKGNSHPDHRAARKAYEKEHHINLDVKDVGLKAAVLVMMAGLACYPKIKSEADIIEREQQLRREKQGRDLWKKRGVREAREGRDGRGRSLDDVSRGEGRGSRGNGYGHDDRIGKGNGYSAGAGSFHGHRHDDRSTTRRRKSVDESRRREPQRLQRIEDARSEISGRARRTEDSRPEPTHRRTPRLEAHRTHEHEHNPRTRRIDDRSSISRSTDRGKRETDRERGSRRWEEGSSRTSGSGSGSDRTQDWVLGGYEYVNADEYRGYDRRMG